jgi:hypothetical protein
MATAAANPFDIQTGAATTNASGTTGGTLTPGTNTTAAQFDPVQRQVNAAQDTTSGQLQRIVAEDSPLMQQARAQAKQGMAARGLVNSSMAQGAGVAAMLEKATPIAKADADTYFSQGITNQNSANVGGQFNVGQQNQFGLQKGAQTFATSERTAGQNFTATQAGLEREQQSKLQTAQQTFTGAQSALDRAQQLVLTDKSIEASNALQKAQQDFAAAQSGLDRAQQTALQTGQQTFTASQTALERGQQNTVLKAQQDFASAQAALDRAQQVSITDKGIAAQSNLQKAQQDFEAAQTTLDRAQKTQLQDDQQSAALEQIGFKAKVDLQNIPTAFAANISNTTMNGVNSIMADGTMTPDAKKAAITNLITYANAQVDWANKFYSATIPPITQPK